MEIQKHNNFQTTIDTSLNEEETSFFGFLKNNGYLFNDSIVENFLLSLKVKPFVILTGNSGTGKTKLAQLFAKYLSKKIGDAEKSFIEIDVKVGKSYLSSNSGWSFKKEAFFNVYPHLRAYEGRYDIEVDGIVGEGKLEIAPRLFYDRNNEFITERLKMYADEDPKKRVMLKIFISEIDRLYDIVTVGANWTENRHIIGYLNAITNQYVSTKSIDLIQLASQNQHLPFFLILDEMNLSHVERYFSDFLSAMESEEPISLHTSDEINTIPKQISIPQNIFVIGTVNVDETTYMFSPKVLDRANTIEFLTMKPTQYSNDQNLPRSISKQIDYLENPLSDIDVRMLKLKDFKSPFEKVTCGYGIEFWPKLLNELDKFHAALAKPGFDFGFRVIDEIIRFMFVAWKFENEPKNWLNWNRYFDAQIIQKILPKIHGSKKNLQGCLSILAELCKYDQSEEILYNESLRKINEMTQTLEDQRYVSFTK